MLNVRVKVDAFDTVHVLLDFGGGSDEPRHPTGGGKRVGQDETGETGVHGVIEDGEEGSSEDDKRGDKVETDTEPAVGRDHGKVGLLVVVEFVFVVDGEPALGVVGTDGSEATEGLGKVRKDGRLGDRLETLEFA